MSTATTVVLVRHGETDWNREGRIQGSTDIPMNDVGRVQAHEAALRLAGAGPWGAVVTSPLARASETAAIIASALELPGPDVLEGIQERRHGVLEGLTVAERRRMQSEAVPVAGLEPRAAVIGRAVPAMQRLSVAHRGGAVVAVTHGGVIQSVLLHVLGRGALPSGSVANGSLHRFRVAEGLLDLEDSDALPFAEPTASA
ncbi:histidine phosphatase family protein [Agromyces marinus]|uniref:histidine phosphatase family protein n=1 Tax=Agromyces marinus TaxID=1389020 RepID=UPI001F2BB006|nr:histidine phosphatase family protein [Agromyces marinus]UIP58620.1 2,3-bisphosphoglycerate-dependent phosphoglycerate mutase [Agromyces marinus]